MHALKTAIKSVAVAMSDTAAQMLFPDSVTCLACGNELNGTTGDALCEACRLDFIESCCRICGRKIDNLAELCDKCMEHEPHQFELAKSSVTFDNTARRLIYGFKYGGARYLAKFMAQSMVKTAQKNGFTDAGLITFVPLHSKRQRKRGYNQSELLAESLSVMLSIPCAALLHKTKHTKNLARLNRAERSEIIHGSFETACERSAVKDKTILLIDDVLTTGATADECAKVLKRAGAQKVWLLTFASVQSKIKPGTI